MGPKGFSGQVTASRTNLQTNKYWRHRPKHLAHEELKFFWHGFVKAFKGCGGTARSKERFEPWGPLLENFFCKLAAINHCQGGRHCVTERTARHIVDAKRDEGEEFFERNSRHWLNRARGGGAVHHTLGQGHGRVLPHGGRTLALQHIHEVAKHAGKGVIVSASGHGLILRPTMEFHFEVANGRIANNFNFHLLINAMPMKAGR